MELLRWLASALAALIGISVVIGVLAAFGAIGIFGGLLIAVVLVVGGVATGIKEALSPSGRRDK